MKKTILKLLLSVAALLITQQLIKCIDKSKKKLEAKLDEPETEAPESPVQQGNA